MVFNIDFYLISNTIKDMPRKYTKEQREESSKRMMGINNPFYGKTHTQETKDLISKIFTGRKLSQEHKDKIGEWNKNNPEKLTYWKGKKQSKEMIEKRVSKTRGELNYQWIKDRTKLCRTSKQGERRTSAYFFWRKEVWKRDNWKCLINNQDCSGRIEAHHILGYKEYPELRYDIKNGITLCHFHHPRKRIEETNMSPYFQNLVAEFK